MDNRRIVQLIDSLAVGGAEKVAVNLANLLVENNLSYLCSTRNSGPLQNIVSEEVQYLSLNKKSTFDLNTIVKFKKWLKKHKIELIHAHGTSYFFAVLVKLLYPKIKIVWHDHNGDRVNTSRMKKMMLQFCSLFFCSIIAVNEELASWHRKKLYCKRVFQINNFVTQKSNFKRETNLKGLDDKRIICLANLRKEKDHFNLVKAFKVVNESNKDWTLHLIGEDKDDLYSKELKKLIKELNLQNVIHIYGSKTDIENILEQGTLGVLSSKSEGLPMALLEYGLYQLGVITTNVGECSKVLNGFGNVVPAQNSEQLAQGIIKSIENTQYLEKQRIAYHKQVINEFSAEAVNNKLELIYQGC
ncbi:MAG: glycosyltransferase [Flavobacteriaceae bacterium]|nr:glycosyltransferase [Flavobacteriaceae bacterium]